MQAAYNVHMEELTSHLRATTSKAITDSIIEVCNATRELRECELDQEWDQTLLDVATVQISVGQRALLGGRWPTRWIEQQKAYNNRTRSKKSPEIWLARTICTTHLHSGEIETIVTRTICTTYLHSGEIETIVTVNITVTKGSNIACSLTNGSEMISEGGSNTVE